MKREWFRVERVNGNDQHFRRLNSTWYSVWGGQLGRIGQQQQK